MTLIRELRLATQASQATFASRLGVAIDSLRAWDAGRRSPPPEILDAARALASAGPDDRPLPLAVLSRLLGVSVCRLREAARDGRLRVTYETRVIFGQPIPRATREAGEAYKRDFYGKKARWVPRPAAPRPFPTVPTDYDRQLVQLRKQMSLSQAELALRVGAAGRAVVYQWETKKRKPSPLFWQRIVDVDAGHRERPDRPFEGRHTIKHLGTVSLRPHS